MASNRGKRHALSAKQLTALDWMRLARASDPTTDDGVIHGAESFYDGEINVAYVNFQTAEALVRRGYVAFGEWRGWDDGQELVLVQ